MPWIIVLGNRAAIEWLTTEGRMAVGPQVRTLPDEGDDLVLYASRGAFGNPTRDRAQVFGLAAVAGPTAWGQVVVSGATYSSSFPLDIEAVTMPHEGLDFLSLVPNLNFILRKEPTRWGGYLRRPIVRIGDDDYATIAAAFREHLSLSRR